MSEESKAAPGVTYVDFKEFRAPAGSPILGFWILKDRPGEVALVSQDLEGRRRVISFPIDCDLAAQLCGTLMEATSIQQVSRRKNGDLYWTWKPARPAK